MIRTQRLSVHRWRLRRAWLPSPTARLYPLPWALCKQVRCLTCWHDKQSPHPAVALRVRVSPCLRWHTSVCVYAPTCVRARVRTVFISKLQCGARVVEVAGVATDVRGFPFPFPPPSPHLSSKSVYPPPPRMPLCTSSAEKGGLTCLRWAPATQSCHTLRWMALMLNCPSMPVFYIWVNVSLMIQASLNLFYECMGSYGFPELHTWIC